MNIASAVESVKASAPSKDTLKDAGIGALKVTGVVIGAGVAYAVFAVVANKVYEALSAV